MRLMDGGGCRSTWPTRELAHSQLVNHNHVSTGKLTIATLLIPRAGRFSESKDVFYRMHALFIIVIITHYVTNVMHKLVAVTFQQTPSKQTLQNSRV